jgi:hypothetical protein
MDRHIREKGVKRSNTSPGMNTHHAHQRTFHNILLPCRQSLPYEKVRTMNQSAVFLIALLLCCVAVFPASAVIAEFSCMGPVEETNAQDGTVIISAAGRLGLSFETDPPTLVVDSIEPVVIKGPAPGGAAGLALFEKGAFVTVTTLGSTDGEIIAIGTVKQTPQGDYRLVNLAGDPAATPVPFAGDYAISYTAEPDCAHASGTAAPATAVNITLRSEGMDIWSQRLEPGQNFTWNGRNDGSAVEVVFVAGEAPAQSCSGSAGMVGPQPVSTFIITVTPPIGLALSEPSIPAPTATAPPSVPPANTPRAAGLLPATALFALIGAGWALKRL